MDKANFAVSTSELESFCRKWKITILELFGSSLREDFSKNSDVDILLTFEPEATPSLFDWVEMKEDAERVFGRPVDILTRKAVETSVNPYRKEEILGTAKVIYEKTAA